MDKTSYYLHKGCKAMPGKLPQHVAIIMDGNGRWAASKGKSRTAGHRQGVASARDIIKSCQEKEIKVLTLFAFGMENWKRPSQEVRNLFRIFFLTLRKEIVRLNENKIKLNVIGDRSGFHATLLDAIAGAERATENNTGLMLNIAVNYSGRWDLMNALSRLMQKNISHHNLSEEAVSLELSLKNLPEPDLFIRTGGVQRISNFMLWELAYTELYFTQTLWPDFTPDEFDLALADFAARERRFGLTGEQVSS